MPSPIPAVSAAPRSYDQQLHQKLHHLHSLLQHQLPGPLEVFRSPAAAYRMRAEFRVWHDGEEMYYVMFPKGDSRTPLKIDSFAPASSRIQELMPQILDYVKSRPVLRQKLFQADFLSTRGGECLLSLIYHRRLDDEWQQEAALMQQALKIKLIGRSRKQKIVLAEDFVTEHVSNGDKILSYKQIENSFTQPNAWINESMLAWALENTQQCENDLLELYCGNGNFSIAIAKNFRKVLATEMDKNGIRAAKDNALANGIENLELVRLSAAEVTAALNGERPFRRLQHLELSNYQFSTVLIDPPRAGLDDKALGFVAEFDQILYISCNPVSLAANLEHLCQSHSIHRAALFDQFPDTEHIECGVLLRRR